MGSPDSSAAMLFWKGFSLLLLALLFVTGIGWYGDREAWHEQAARHLDERASFEAERTSLEARLGESTRQFVRSEETRAAGLDDNASLRKRLTSVTEEREALRLAGRDLRHDVASERAERIAMEAGYVGLAQRALEGDAAADELRLELSEAERRAESTFREAAALAADVLEERERKAASVKLVAALEQRTATATTDLERLKARLARAELLREESKHELLEVAAAKSATEARVGVLQEKLAEARGEVAALQQAIDGTRSAEENARLRIEDLRKDVAGSRRAVGDSQRHVRTLRAERDELKRSLDQHRRDREAMIQEYMRGQDRNRRLEASLNVAKEQARKLEVRLAKLDREKRALVKRAVNAANPPGRKSED